MDFSEILRYFPTEVGNFYRKTEEAAERVREIRIRVGCPPVIVSDTLHVGDEPLGADAVRRTAERLCQNSIYARQGDLRQGFVTIAGGHRAGICGRTVVEDGKVHHLADISSVNLRVAHQILGAADRVMPSIVQGTDILNTLVISPPAAGKTTLLRDIARQLGGGTYRFRVGLLDERGEIAAMYRGEAQNDVGFLTDVYDGCPKAEGMRMLLRGMSPQVLITDEIGTRADGEAITEAVYSGVSVICSLHGIGKEDALSKEGIGTLLRNGIFRRVIVLRPVGIIASMT